MINLLTAAGVDGCPLGWAAVVWRGGGLDLRLAMRWEDLDLADCDAVGVDMPIGLSDRGPRGCDALARAQLPRERKSSVFAPPRRYQLDLGWPEANQRGKAVEGVGLAKQAWYLGRKIAELDRALTPGDQDRIFECHPEVAFHALADGVALPRKTTAAGRAARLRLLQTAGLPDPGGLMSRWPRRDVRADDIIDAAVCSLVARSILAGTARRLPPESPPRDARGLRMEIWF